MNDIEKFKNEVYPLLKELCAIPAPSHYEDKRAEFCKNYLLNAGFEKVYIDEAKNVICEYGCENSNNITVFAAHTDTVFPDMEPMPFVEKGDIAYCPGIGDDTASLAVLLVSAKYIIKNNISPKNGVLFVCNSCEEGLGNLKGTRALMKAYEGRIKYFVTFDSVPDIMVTRCVGSHRYNVKVTTEGGHSFNKFGNKNAIAALSEMVNEIYKIEVPAKENTKTTYNVGTIRGGTSVNTIAQSAEMLCEYRSDDVDCLNVMKDKFTNIFNNAKSEKVGVEVTLVGERPCSADVDKGEFDYLVNKSRDIIKGIIGKDIVEESGSTDCNIPMSLGVPSVCVGVYRGAGYHTREEWIEISSLPVGLQISVELIKAFI